MAGLSAAKILQTHGKSVLVVDKARGVGGRMATRRLEDSAIDHGAQYFTARDARFQAWVANWQAEKVVQPWAQGFTTADGTLKTNDEWRYIGSKGMTSIPKFMAQGLDIHLRERVSKLDWQGKGWEIYTENELAYTAPAVILTAPVPQSLAMLDAGNFQLPVEIRAQLEKIAYQPCFAVMAVLEQPSKIPAPGGQWLSGEPVAWMADNHQKGITEGYGVTIHAGPDFTRQHWDTDKNEVAQLLLDAAEAWLGSRVIAVDVQRWRYSQPTVLHPDFCLALDSPAPLIFAGDAFNGSRVEGAALSGMAAAEALLNFR